MLVVRRSSAYLLGRGEFEVEHRLEVEPHAALGPPVREAGVERAAVARERLLGAEELQRGQRRRRAHVQPGCVHAAVVSAPSAGPHRRPWGPGHERGLPLRGSEQR